MSTRKPAFLTSFLCTRSDHSVCPPCPPISKSTMSLPGFFQRTSRRRICFVQKSRSWFAAHYQHGITFYCLRWPSPTSFSFSPLLSYLSKSIRLDIRAIRHCWSTVCCYFLFGPLHSHQRCTLHLAPANEAVEYIEKQFDATFFSRGNGYTGYPTNVTDELWEDLYNCESLTTGLPPRSAMVLI